MSVGFPANAKLHQWAYAVKQVFGGSVYLVGSALTEKNTRDVDVVCILDDEEFQRVFGSDDGSEWNWRWAGICIAFSEWGRSQTGLNIDFKYQALTKANGRHNKPRGALGHNIGPAPYKNTYRGIVASDGADSSNDRQIDPS